MMEDKLEALSKEAYTFQTKVLAQENEINALKAKLGTLEQAINAGLQAINSLQNTFIAYKKEVNKEFDLKDVEVMSLEAAIKTLNEAPKLADRQVSFLDHLKNILK